MTALRTSLAALALLAGGDALAAQPPKLALPHAGLEARDVAVRQEVEVAWHRPPQGAIVAWTRFLAVAAGWQAVWDSATGVPLRLYGRGLPAAGASSGAAAAEAHARAILADHVDLLAPGVRPSDFVVVANVSRNGVRTVGLKQTAGGMAVVGGQLSFRYKHDQLIAIGSEALPRVVAAPPAARVADDLARLYAAGWMMKDLGAAVTTGAVDGPMVLPLIGAGGVLGYRTVVRVAVESEKPRTAWDVYLDAESGAAVARRQTLRFANGEVTFEVPVRHPSGGREKFLARHGSFTVNGAAAMSDDAGIVSWAGAAAGALQVRAQGPLVAVDNQAGANATAQFTLPASGKVNWNGGNSEVLEAQLNTFIHARLIKDWVKTRMAPDLAWLDEQLPVNVNIDDSCNAFSDGNSINFFVASAQCANTGRLADVVYHEFGHSLHAHSIVDGAGAFDGAFSEGLSDYLAASLTNDPGMGRGFFFDDGPLRHIDPADREARWPEDVAEIHTTGLIFGGAMWDLRELLIEKHGAGPGSLIADRLFYGAVQRASSIPATYVEVLVEDDDDGDLSNGTPNVCEINAAFAAHGLRQVAVDLAPLGVESLEAEGYDVSLQVSGLQPECAGDGVASAELSWLLRGDPLDRAQTIAMGEVDAGWQATIPAQAEGSVVRYQVHLEFIDGSRQTVPDNPADPHLELYVGGVVELYCTDFESDPFAEGWTHGLLAGEATEGADDWTWGAPSATASSGDPADAYSGQSVLGNDLGGPMANGLYQADKTNFATTPVIETGEFSDVRLQYRRWLTVEDAFFDQASILANGEVAWQNLNSDQGDQSSTQHHDREWRFHDVPLSPFITDGTVQLTYQLQSDGGLEFGGWTIDDFCVVAAADKVCGDGLLVAPEACDDGEGNSDSEPDACRTTCEAATCGDGVVDSGEVCDDGNLVDGDGCEATCAAAEGDEGGDCGCRVGVARGPSLGAGFLVALMVAAVAFLRRRRV